jgi:hypothetical protein
MKWGGTMFPSLVHLDPISILPLQGEHNDSHQLILHFQFDIGSGYLLSLHDRFRYTHLENHHHRVDLKDYSNGRKEEKQGRTKRWK